MHGRSTGQRAHLESQRAACSFVSEPGVRRVAGLILEAGGRQTCLGTVRVHRGPARVPAAVLWLLQQVSRGHGPAVAKCKFARVHLRAWQPRLGGRVGREETRVEISCVANRLLPRSLAPATAKPVGPPASCEACCSPAWGGVPASQPPTSGLLSRGRRETLPAWPGSPAGCNPVLTGGELGPSS